MKFIVLTTIGPTAHPNWMRGTFGLKTRPLTFLFNRTGVDVGSSDVDDKVNYQKRNVAVTDARNQLLAMALKLDWDYAVWVDSDIELRPDTIEKYLRYINKGEKFITAIGIYRQGHTVKNHMINHNIVNKPYNRDFVYCEWTGFLCVCIAREVHTKVGKFSPYIGGEDVDYCLRARRLGYNIAVAEDILMRHYYRDTERKTKRLNKV